jgi:beta-1,4-N-acetylglucosaminyltransferase
MIFITVGSTDFDALIRRVDVIAPGLNEDIVMQIGDGEYTPTSIAQFFRYAPSLEPYMIEADLIISHGGLGTVMEALHQGKKLIAVSNPDRYDTHQDDLLAALSEAGHLIWCRDLDRLDQAITKARESTLVPYRPPECRIHHKIRQFLIDRC